ncbi:MAG: ABC transporter ATP-binding protein [Agathobacter sp.]
MELEIKNITKKYKTKPAVDQISVTLKQGVYGLLGANGAGKTTLMRMICGVLRIDEGEILWDGENIERMDERYRELLGYLPQDFGYYPNFTVMEFMLYIASLKGLTGAYAKQKTKVLLQTVGLEKNSRTKIKALSGGMKQRLGIAQCLLNDPKILVLDEPTAGLDPKERVRFRNMIAKLGKDRIVLLSTHIVADVEEIADWIFIMKEGRIVEQGTVEHLKEESLGDTGVSLEKVYLHYFGEEDLNDAAF